jgi:hypothetical protein
MHNVVRLGVIRICWITTVGAVLIACKSAEAPASSSQITLTYDGASKSAIFFILENHTAQAVSFRGDRTFWSGPIPWDTSMVCTEGKFSHEDETPMGLSDGFPQAIKVSPGRRLRFRVEGEGIALAAKHKGDPCYLRLRLIPGNIIESKVFVP